MAPKQPSNLITETVLVYNMMITYGSTHNIIRKFIQLGCNSKAVYDVEVLQKEHAAVCTNTMTPSPSKNDGGFGQRE